MKILVSLFVFTLLFVANGVGQGFSKMYGRDSSYYLSPKIIKLKDRSYCISGLQNLSFTGNGIALTKIDQNGQILFCKRLFTSDSGDYQFPEIRFFHSYIYVYYSLHSLSDGAVILKIDTNGNLLHSVALRDRMVQCVYSNEKLVFATYYNNSGIAKLVEFNEDLVATKSLLLKFNSNRTLYLKDFVKYNNSYFTYIPVLVNPSVNELFRTLLVQIDTSFSIGSLKLINDSINGDPIFLRNERLLFRNKLVVNYNRLSPDGNCKGKFGLLNLDTDTIEYKLFGIKKNILLDTFPDFDVLYCRNKTNDSIVEITASKNDSSDGQARFEFSGEFNIQTFNIKLFRRKSPTLYIINSPVPPSLPGRYSPCVIRTIQATNFYRFSYSSNLDLSDPSNCIADPDSGFVTHCYSDTLEDFGPIAIVDTTADIEPFPFPAIVDFKLCEMDYCNPHTYSGLGPDSSTCADSVLLKGKVVYPGQRLVWSTGDTTLNLKVKSGNEYRIKISGICGTYEDTIQISQKVSSSVAFPQTGDTFTACTPVLLQPTAQQWISPRWVTPRGEVLNQQQLFADTSGLYIIQNDEGDCARRDTIYIYLQPVSRPDLQLPDTILTCKDVLLSPMANQWGNPSWQTPGGVFGSISIMAELTGKYVIQNEVLGCRAKDSVYIIRKSPSVISFFNQPDTVFTCQSVLLSPVAQPFIIPVWQTPNGTFTNVNSFRATSSGAYKVTNDIGNCANSDSVYIVYRDTADIDFLLRSGGANLTNFDIVLKENQFPFVVDAVTQTQAFRYTWFLNGQIQSGNGFTEGFSLPNPGVYTIDLLTQTVDSCIGKARKVLTIQELILPAPVIPNLVTLNGDQQNEHFEIKQLPFYPDNELIIYNRWGKEIFRSRPYQNDWPPSDLSAGTYFYRVQAGEVTYQGWVEVVRE